MLMKIWTGTLLFLAWMFFCAWLVLVCREKNVHPLRDFAGFFKKQTKVGQVIFGTFFLVMWIFASIKPGESGGDGGGEGGNGGTNLVQMVVRPGQGYLPQGQFPGIATNIALRGELEETGLRANELPGAISSIEDEWTDFTPITSTNTTRTLDADDFRRGFVVTRIGTDETHGFDAPSGATVCADWEAFGAAEDWIYLALSDWAFALGTNTVASFRILSNGRADPLPPATNRWFAPLHGSLGVVPSANWPRIRGNEAATPEDLQPSRFWHCVTPSNTLQITWQNVLLGRDTNTPVCVQMEMWPSGRFTYRYDLSRIDSEESTNILVGASVGSIAWATNSLPTNVTSIAFYPLAAEDAVNQDRDGDGLTLLDELFVYGTDPELWDTDFDGISDGDEVAVETNPRTRDSDGDGLVDGSDPDPATPTPLDDLDGDGIPDAYEIYWFGGTNVYDTAANRDATGFTLETKILAGINPTNRVRAANVVSTNSCVAWHLFDGFALDLPAGATNLVWERTFAVNRSSAWQQFFVSASPTNAAAWSLHGAVLEWETDMGTTGSASASPFGDSLRIPLAADDIPSSITLRLRAADGQTVHSPTPIHLVAYSPEFRIEGGSEITGESGAKFSVFTEGSESQISLIVDHSLRPCRASPGADECDMDEFEDLSMTSGDFSFDGDASGGTVTANRPGIYALPDFSLGVSLSVPLRSPRRSGRRGGGRTIVVLDPSVGWNCYGHGCGYDGLGYDWDGDWYHEEDYYPLDSKCLRKKWYRDWEGGWSHDSCELYVSSGLGDDGCVTTSTDGNSGKVYVDGVEVWSGSAEHTYDDYGCGDGYHEDYLGDECGNCDSDCADGNCDSLEGPSLGSLKFRIPLGAPVKGQVAGFVWFATETPIGISKSVFSLLRHPDATVTDTVSSGVRRIVCTDSRGRDLRIEDIQNGTRIAIYETDTQTLEHTWEIVNVNGDPTCVRLRKISRLDNVMSDETFTYADGDWTRFDNIAGVATQLTTYNDFSDYGDGTKTETRTTTDAAGNVLSSVMTEQSRIGECGNAVMRETYRAESTGWGWKWSQADWWNDPAHSGRHGQPRLVRGNARAWVYTDFDENGHETLRVEQRGSAGIPSDFPYVVSNELRNASSLADAFVTVRDFTPLAGDSEHEDDAARPRTETRYVVTNGVAIVIGRTWTRYVRLNRDGYAAVKRETWRACAPDAAIGDVGNAYSCEITYADTGEGTPLLMRNAVAESLVEDGVRTINAYSLTNGVLSCVTRRYGPNAEGSPSPATAFPTYAVTERDAAYGTVLRQTTRLTDGDTVIADEQSVYDDQNRLRSTTYLDGTSLTNAYSCCRLLWKRDREGRRILRSAETGTDHLYNAMEDVWLADVSTNGQYRVTQHFHDALGRETNIVVYVAATPGEATVASASAGKAYTTVTISYPYGGSDYAVRTDERGLVTIRRIDILANCTESGEALFTNGVEVVRTKSRSYFGGGMSTRREWGGDKFTEKRRFDGYLADGRRVAYVVTESHDCGVVTNSVTTYDWLGREAAVETPLSSVAYAYDGSSSRILSATDSKSGVTTACLYDACGELVGASANGVTSRTDVAYEVDASNVAWRVTTETSFASSRTNGWTVTCERLTGLSDALRSRVETETMRGAKTCAERTYDAASGVTTETRTASDGADVVSRSRFGVELERTAGGETRRFAYDALGRNVRVESEVGGVIRPVSAFAYDAAGTLVSAATYTNGTDAVAETYAYDRLGNRVATIDALGNAVLKAYDAAGNAVAEGGATYPVRRAYDSQSRRTSLATTRDGAAWDATGWAFDAATGLCASKTYADGSTVAYTHTPDGFLSRTAYASGRWFENVYDAKRQVVGRLSSDGSDDAAFARDAFGRIVSSANGSASVAYALADGGTATNEAWTVGGEAATLVRALDAQGRVSSLALSGSGCAQSFAYDADGRLAVVSNAEASVNYAYTPDGRDAGYTLTLADGTVFVRSVVRDPHRRDLVTRVESLVNDIAVESFSYAYDALSRPVSRNADTFGYNVRGEVVSSRGGAESAERSYAYDGVGNAVLAASGGVTNAYAANALNQYASVLRASAPPRETVPQYDADGNLVAFGTWAFAYDAANRLASVSSNGVLLVSNFYDAKSRRVKKVTPEATTTFFYDDWNLVEERIAYANGTTSTIRYFWGKDFSGDLQGAGGVGGLLCLTVNGAIYIPCYDNNGNVTRYLDANGNTVAQYAYDAFGGLVAKTGPLADLFRHRFSMKYFDAETGLYYYGYRFYSPSLMRWLNRDPIEEEGGLNLYAACENNAICNFDSLGEKIEITEERYDVRDNIGRDSRAYFSRNSSINIYCTMFGVLKIDGIAYRKLSILTPGHNRWNERYKRYNEKWGIGRNSTQEWQAAYAHEMDHWNSFNALFAFLRMLNEFDGTRLCLKCDEMKDALEKQYRTLYMRAVMRSSRYDSPGFNYGGAYPK